MYNSIVLRDRHMFDPVSWFCVGTLHDFRRTAITGLQMAGVSEKETSLMVVATPEVIRKHYEKLDAMAIAKRNIERRLAANHQSPAFVAPVARAARKGLDERAAMPQT